MKVVFVRPKMSDLISGAVILFLFSVFIIVMFPKESWVYILVPIGLVGFIGFLVEYIRILSSRKVKSLFEAAIIDKSRIAFPEPLSIEEGFFEAVEEQKRGQRGKSRHVDRRFISKNKGNKNALELKEEPFLCAVNENGEGKIYLPGARILDKRYKDAVILYIKPDYSISFSKEKISVSYQNDHAEMRVSQTGNGFKGSLYILTRLNSARKAKIELIAPLRTYQPVKKRIVEAERSAEFEHRFLDEPMVVVSHYKTLSPKNLKKELGLDRIIEGHGNYSLRLSLDIPFKRDVEEEIDLKVEPGRKT